jgi:hypothetical protein
LHMGAQTGLFIIVLSTIMSESTDRQFSSCYMNFKLTRVGSTV